MILPALNFTSWWTRRVKERVALGSIDPFGLFRVSLPLHDLDTHIYVVGKTKKGKSQFLNGLLFQLITQGQGVGLLDPHADLVSDLLSYLASYPQEQPWLSQVENRERLIYFDPSRDDYIIPCNLLASPGHPYTVAQNILEAMRRTWPESLREAPRFADVALHSLLVLIANGLTLVELPRLLTDRDFRERCLARVDQADVQLFFHRRFDRWGREGPLMIESLLNKVSALTLNPKLRLILGASENRLDLRRIMDEGKVLIVNLGSCDQETRDLLGSLLTVFLEQAAFSRVELPKEERRPYFLAIDEFQRFTANEGSARVLAEVLSECRKYRLHLIFAHQYLSQLESERLLGALEQAQVKVVFGTGRRTAQAIAGELFSPDLEKIKHEVQDEAQQERSHPLFAPLQEQFEGFTQALQRLARRTVYVQLPEKERVARLRTLTIPASRITPEALEELKRTLVRKDGKPCQELEGEIARRVPTGDTAPVRAWETVSNV